MEWKKEERTWRCGRVIRFSKHAVAMEKLNLEDHKSYVKWETEAVKLSRKHDNRYVAAAFSVSEGRAVEITDRIEFTTPISCHFDYPEKFWGTEIWVAYAYLPSTEACKKKWEKGQDDA